MSKKETISLISKSLINVADELRAIADNLQEICSAGAKDKTNEKAEEAAEETTAKIKSQETISLEKVRGILADKSRNGHTAEVRAIIQKHGADRLSDIDPKDYAKVIAEAEALI